MQLITLEQILSARTSAKIEFCRARADAASSNYNERRAILNKCLPDDDTHEVLSHHKKAALQWLFFIRTLE
jgi:hypothetical protein